MIKFIIFCTLFNISNIECKHKREIIFADDEEDICVTPDGRAGICDPVVDCEELLNDRNLIILRQSICGFDNEMPKVCCPLDKKVMETTLSQSMATAVPITIVPELSDQPSNEPTIPERPQTLPEFCGNTSIISGTRIVGGKASRPGSWPWMAAIFIQESGRFVAQCGGALVSEQDIITASHCVVESGRVLTPNRLRVRLGEHNILKKTKEDAEVDYDVIEVISHQDFEPQTYRNDIAIIKLSEKVRFNSRVWPICLPFDALVLNSEENVGRSGYITGWGKQAFNGESSEVLREAMVEIISNKECGKAFNGIVDITDEYMCAGSVGSTIDSCQGDSGGPLIQVDPDNRLYYLTGIVSFGRRCATPGYPGVYARVSTFLKWILNNI